MTGWPRPKQTPDIDGRMSSRRGGRVAIACGVMVLAAVTLLSKPGMPAARAQRFVSGAELVRVDVLVSNGPRLVTGLTADDFEVRDRGVVQRIRSLDVETLDVDVICVFDTSGSVAGPLLHRLAEGGHALVGALRPGDRIALLAFANRVSVVAPLSGDRSRVAAAIETLSAQGRTALRDAAFAGLALSAGGATRSLVLLFSDGVDTASWLTPARVLDAARRTDIVVYPVTVGVRGRGETEFIGQLADETGGRPIRADRAGDLQQAFTAILAEFRTRYVLAYEPERSGGKGWHPIAVTLKGKAGRVTTRRGYFAE